MHDATVVERIRRKLLSITPLLDERSRRHWAAAEARELGWGGVSLMAQATGLSRTTIAAGLAELNEPPATRGDPISPLRWTCKMGCTT